MEKPGRARPVTLAIVAVSSTIGAFGIAATRGRPLGDDPVAMIVYGCVLAAVTGALRWGRPLHLGLAAMTGFPVWALVDLAANGGHNLLPFEFALYAAYAGLGVVAATLSHSLRSAKSSSEQ